MCGNCLWIVALGKQQPGNTGYFTSEIEKHTGGGRYDNTL